MEFLTDVTLGMAARDALAVPAAAALLPRGTAVDIGFIDGETGAQRIRAARAVVEARLAAVPHVSARRLISRGDLDEYLGALASEGAASRVFVVGGDPRVPAGPYSTALDVLRSGALERHGVRSVSIGGHPGGHPRVDSEALWSSLREKARHLEERGMAGEIITQLTFDPGAALDWIGRVRDHGIAMPVRVGVPGPVLGRTVFGLARQFGAQLDDRVAARYGADPGRPDAVVTASNFLEELVSGFVPDRHGTVGVHTFNFGRLVDAASWAAGVAVSSIRHPGGLL